MFRFLRCVGEAVLAQGVRGLMGAVPFGELVYDVASDAIGRYKHQQLEEELASDVEKIVSAHADDIRREAKVIVQQIAANRSPAEQAQLENYLTQIPSVAKNSVRRANDPSGNTVKPGMNLKDPIQLASLLPHRMPLFKAGEKVPNAPNWKLKTLLGAGGFGEVWMAENSDIEERRAYKFCLDPHARERLLRYEGEVVRRVLKASKRFGSSRDGVVPLLDAHLQGESPWLAYAYVQGGDLANLVMSWNNFRPELRVKNIMLTLQRLSKVVGQWHRLPEPVVHRDLKPANILVETVAKQVVFHVTDFGIGSLATTTHAENASHSTPKMSLGETFRGAHTPLYASPQQKKGLAADVRDDVFALGINAWQMLLGDWSAERPAGKWRKRVEHLPIPTGFLDLLESCWDDDPLERPKDASEISETIGKILDSKQQSQSFEAEEVIAEIVKPPLPPNQQLPLLPPVATQLTKKLVITNHTDAKISRPLISTNNSSIRKVSKSNELISACFIIAGAVVLLMLLLINVLPKAEEARATVANRQQPRSDSTAIKNPDVFERVQPKAPEVSKVTKEKSSAPLSVTEDRPAGFGNTSPVTLPSNEPLISTSSAEIEMKEVEIEVPKSTVTNNSDFQTFPQVKATEVEPPTSSKSASIEESDTDTPESYLIVVPKKKFTDLDINSFEVMLSQKPKIIEAGSLRLSEKSGITHFVFQLSLTKDQLKLLKNSLSNANTVSDSDTTNSEPISYFQTDPTDLEKTLKEIGLKSIPVNDLVAKLHEAASPALKVTSMQAFLGLGESAAPAIPLLIENLDDNSNSVRATAIRVLGDLKATSLPAIKPLEKLVEETKDDEIRGAAMHAMMQIDPKSLSVRKILTKALVGGTGTKVKILETDTTLSNNRIWACSAIIQLQEDGEWAATILEDLLVLAAQDLKSSNLSLFKKVTKAICATKTTNTSIRNKLKQYSLGKGLVSKSESNITEARNASEAAYQELSKYTSNSVVVPSKE